MLNWEKKYEIGIPKIDEQHQHLFEIGNDIYSLLNDPMAFDKYDHITALITELKDYTKYHFASEEALMLKLKYRGYFEQKTAHDDFVAKIEAVNLNDVDKDQDKFINDLLIFVFNWILEHILKSDMKITAEV